MYAFPLAAGVTAVYTSGSPSGSLSLASAFTWPGRAWFRKSAASSRTTGAWLAAQAGAAGRRTRAAVSTAVSERTSSPRQQPGKVQLSPCSENGAAQCADLGTLGGQ